MAQYIGNFENRGFKEMGDNIKVFDLANPRETCHGSKNREVRKIEGLKNRNSTVNQR